MTLQFIKTVPESTGRKSRDLMRVFHVFFWVVFLTVFPRFQGWIFSAWNDEAGYRLEDISYAEKDPAESHAIINDTVVREGDQVGKLGIRKIEQGGVLVEDKITGETKYIFQEKGIPKFQVEVPDGLDERYVAMLRSELESAAPDQVEIRRSPDPSEGPVWQEGVQGVTYDAAWTVADLIQYPREGIQDDFSFGNAIRKYRESLGEGSAEAAELQTRLIAMTRERIQNCRRIEAAYGERDPETLGDAQRTRLTGCSNYLEGRR